MKLVVSLQSTLKEKVKGGDKPLAIEAEPGVKVKNLIATLGLNPGEVGLIINHRQEILALDDELNEDMELSLYPIFGGG